MKTKPILLLLLCIAMAGGCASMSGGKVYFKEGSLRKSYKPSEEAVGLVVKITNAEYQHKFFSTEYPNVLLDVELISDEDNIPMHPHLKEFRCLAKFSKSLTFRRGNLVGLIFNKKGELESIGKVVGIN